MFCLHVHLHAHQTHFNMKGFAQGHSRRKTITLCSIGLTPFILIERELNAFSDMAKINALFMTKMAEKPYPLGPHMSV